MRVLVACEFSGIVREAFAAKGHDAWSCDLLPTEIPGKHYQGDVKRILFGYEWDLMIAHPPCTFLANTCAYRWKDPDYLKQREDAYAFFLWLYTAPIKKICIENPAGWLNSNFKKPDQIIHPYYFGDYALKRTCLWLKDLPPLSPTNLLERPKPSGHYIRKSGKRAGKKYNYYFHNSKSSHERSRSFKGIANAMAEQWGAKC
jgi:hypothetical protein